MLCYVLLWRSLCAMMLLTCACSYTPASTLVEGPSNEAATARAAVSTWRQDARRGPPMQMAMADEDDDNVGDTVTLLPWLVHDRKDSNPNDPTAIGPEAELPKCPPLSAARVSFLARGIGANIPSFQEQRDIEFGRARNLLLNKGREDTAVARSASTASTAAGSSFSSFSVLGRDEKARVSSKGEGGGGGGGLQGLSRGWPAAVRAWVQRWALHTRSWTTKSALRVVGATR